MNHLLTASLQQIPGLNKPGFKFLISFFETWLGLPVRYTILNLSRFGHYCEKSIRLQMEREFDFTGFNMSIIQSHCTKELIAVFDPTFIAKAGKHTPGLGRWWSGKDNRAMKGLEIGVLGLIDVQNATAMSLKAVQTPSIPSLRAAGKTLIDHYADLIVSQMAAIKLVTNYLAVDGYFMKQEFIRPVAREGLHIITKMRPDANLRYLYKGPRRQGRGRPRRYEDKIDCNNIDKRKIRKFAVDENGVYYSGIVYAITLKQQVRIVFIIDRKTGRHDILLSTDPSLAPTTIVKYYKLRFQVEFLIRDAKQHAGLDDCQARDQAKLSFHYNMALSAVSVAKTVFWLKQSSDKRGAFSMRNVKVAYYNRFLTQTIFSNLGLDMNCKKIKRLYLQCLDTGKLAA